MEFVAVAVGASVIAGALLVWWVASTITKSERRASHWEVEALTARAQAAASDKRATNAEAALEKRDAAYEALNARFVKLATVAISAVDDASAVALAGGDPGDPGGPPVVGGPGDGKLPSDRLLEPDWDADGNPG